MAYTEIDNPTDFFRTKLYTGNGADGQAITYDESENMTPNFVWIKERNSTSAHKLIDSVRGANKAMSIDQTEADRTHQYLADFNDANGFTIGTTDGGTNQNNNTFVSWNWKAGTAFTNDASSTSVGSIDSAGSVNTDAGFSIISFTDDGSNATIAHGLGVVPKAIIIKNRAATEDWYSYWQPLGNDKQLRLSSTAAVADAGSMWNDTTPTSSVFSLDADAAGLSSGNYIAYCFAEKQGYSKIGSYTGNGNVDGAFVYTGFKPAFVLTRAIAATENWPLFDNKRDIGNVVTSMLRTDSNQVEDTSDSYLVDFLSNGFKWRASDGKINGNGAAYIFLAFAENPFVTSTGVPATAR